MAQLISVKDLRLKFPWVAEQLARGREFLLLLRSKPIAKIVPVSESAREKAVDVTALFANPPKNMLLRTKKSAVQIIREERKRFHER